jgi:hypothetical protein
MCVSNEEVSSTHELSYSIQVGKRSACSANNFVGFRRESRTFATNVNKPCAHQYKPLAHPTASSVTKVNPHLYNMAASTLSRAPVFLGRAFIPVHYYPFDLVLDSSGRMILFGMSKWPDIPGTINIAYLCSMALDGVELQTLLQ